MAPSKSELQFGRPEGADPVDRPCAYGICLDAAGRIALARITGPSSEWWDLPGGALDPGEGDAEALVREFGEETGLKVRAGRLLTRASQYMVKSDGQPVNNLSGLYIAELEGFDPALKVEDDHALGWVEPLEALKRLRHDSHAWAVTVWLRTTDT
jgi:8-oxo-dGTP diphosphatase